MNIQNSYKPLTAFLSLLFLLMFFTPNKVSATHEMGGLITWDCLGNGDYVFRFQYYRDCDGIGFPSTLNLSVYNHPTLSSIPVSLVQTIDRSTPCDTCNGTLPGRVEEFIYESSPITLSGIPGPQGWTFTYDICCRNPVVGNLNNPATQGYSFRANMYSYNGQAADPCYDSSPRFAESPDFALCTSFPVGLNNLSVDPELDSLVYEWASAFDQFN
ncbi:MAG: hypothetical protein HKO56_09380, partial [Bacteroidia bacterium]|nr:hypothetical protein [Bacteroidia bacterium]